MWTKEASAWLKDQKDAFTGQRASAPPRVLPAQEKAKRKELAGEARAFSTEWAGNTDFLIFGAADGARSICGAPRLGAERAAG